MSARRTEFQVGHWADHRSGRFDPLRVTRVEGGLIWLAATGADIGPFRADDYDNTRDADVYHDTGR